MDRIKLDLDRDRIKAIVEEALRMIYEYVGGDFLISKDEIMDRVSTILENGMVSSQFFLKLGSTKIPDLELRVDPIKKKVLCKSTFRKRVTEINYFMRIL